MLKAVAAEVEKKSDYTTAQSALAKCMTANLVSGTAPTPPFNTLDDVLSRYTGVVKAVAETTCGTHLNNILDVIESESPSALKTLKAGSTESASEYAALLETPRGKDLAAQVGDLNGVKRYLTILASASTPAVSGASDTHLGRLF